MAKKKKEVATIEDVAAKPDGNVFLSQEFVDKVTKDESTDSPSVIGTDVAAVPQEQVNIDRCRYYDDPYKR